MGVPTFIVTHQVPDGWPHEDSNIRFVTNGLDSAVAQAKAGGRRQGRRCRNAEHRPALFDAVIFDQLHLNVVPVLLGAGVPFFAELATAPVGLRGPEVVESEGVTHLTYTVVK